MDEPEDQFQEDGPELTQPPGELLAQAREAQGLSRIRVSEMLGLTQTVIRDIELSRFDKFPSGIYLRGYIRNYCKLVSADEQQILDAYDLYGKTHEVPEESPFGSALPASNQSNRKQMVFTISVVVFLAIAILSVLLIFNKL